MKRTEFIHFHGRWFLGFWLTKSIGAEWGDYAYYSRRRRTPSFSKTRGG